MSTAIQEKNHQPNRLVKIISAIMAVMFLSLFMLHVIGQIKIDTPAILLLILISIAGLIFSGFIKGIKWKDFEFNFGELKGRQDELEKQQRELTRQQELQNRLIDLTKFILSGLVGVHERNHLKKLNSEGRFGYKPRDTFKDELSRLLSLNFIGRRTDKGIRSMMADSDPNNNDLKTHFFITDRGKEYLGYSERFSEFFSSLQSIEIEEQP